MAAIPSRANLSGLKSLVDHLQTMNLGAIVVYDNGYPPKALDSLSNAVTLVDANEWPFYRMWNHAWAASRNMFDAVAILNDDITLHDQSLAEAYKVMLASRYTGIVGLNYERPVSKGVAVNAGSRKVHGSYRNHGIGGHAFLIRSSTFGDVPMIDERYNLWYGDDELFEAMSAYGYDLKIALGAPVDHETSTTTNQFPELLAKTAEDAKLFMSKWA